LLEQTRTKPDEAVIVGDSSNDILTGRNAGMWTCGVTYGFAPHTLALAPPDVEVDSPHELREVFLAS
jgi:phosphoglycolate phosphatase-like HAD superfamily hydrolase